MVIVGGDLAADVLFVLHSSEHAFYVDTKVTPPRSIWVHPHDVRSLPPSPRSR